MMRQIPFGVVRFGAPLDLTGSYRSGTRFGPQQIRAADEVLEDYSLTLDRDVRQVKVLDRGDLELPPGDLEGSLAAIEEEATGALQQGMAFVALGGEHLITLPLVRAALSRYPDLGVLHFDAHADLADRYRGSRLTHATVMRRVVELLGPGRVVQVGVRSATPEEAVFAREWTHFFPGPPPDMAAVLDLLAGRPVYCTIDVDVVDPGFAPGVGTPEPGGWSSTDLVSVLHRATGLDVVGMDVVEVCPPYDPAGITACLAAKLLREALLVFFYRD
jgi:agmatinase